MTCELSSIDDNLLNAPENSFVLFHRFLTSEVESKKKNIFLIREENEKRW